MSFGPKFRMGENEILGNAIDKPEIQREKYRYSIEELRELASDGSLDASTLSDDELEDAMNDHLLPWTAENCNRLLHSGIQLARKKLIKL